MRKTSNFEIPRSSCNGPQTRSLGLANKGGFEPTIAANMRGLKPTLAANELRFGSWPLLVIQVNRSTIAMSEERIVTDFSVRHPKRPFKRASG
jgi:hypothetical protein